MSDSDVALREIRCARDRATGATGAQVLPGTRRMAPRPVPQANLSPANTYSAQPANSCRENREKFQNPPENPDSRSDAQPEFERWAENAPVCACIGEGDFSTGSSETGVIVIEIGDCLTSEYLTPAGSSGG